MYSKNAEKFYVAMMGNVYRYIALLSIINVVSHCSSGPRLNDKRMGKEGLSDPRELQRGTGDVEEQIAVSQDKPSAAEVGSGIGDEPDPKPEGDPSDNIPKQPPVVDIEREKRQTSTVKPGDQSSDVQGTNPGGQTLPPGPSAPAAGPNDNSGSASLPFISDLPDANGAVPPSPGLASRRNYGCGLEPGEKVFPVRSTSFLFKLPGELDTTQKGYWVRCERAMWDSAICWLTDENRFPILIKDGEEKNFRWSFTVKGCSSKLKNVTPMCAQKEHVIAKEITIIPEKIDQCRGSTLTFSFTDVKRNLSYTQKLNFIATSDDF